MIYSIHPAAEHDISSILYLNRELIYQYENLDCIDCTKILAWVERNIEKNFPYFRRVEVRGVTAGYYALVPVCDKYELDSFFILPEFQNQGIGTDILRKCLQSSHCTIYLYVFQKNTGAIRLYQRMGFSVREEISSTRYIMQIDP